MIYKKDCGKKDCKHGHHDRKYHCLGTGVWTCKKCKKKGGYNIPF